MKKTKLPEFSDFGFTPAEIKICRLLATGDGRKEIAEKTGSALPTLDTHLKSIRRKMHVLTTSRASVILTNYF